MKLIILFTCLLVTANLVAQQSTNAAGGDAIGIGGAVAFSIGQIDYISETSNAGLVSQGVQQSYVVQNTSIEKNAAITNINAFPNPTTDELVININNISPEGLQAKLFDQLGNELQSANFTDTLLRFSLLTLANGVYFVSVYDNDTQLEKFKIIKTK